MAISGLGQNYNASAYLWQQQKLTGTASSGKETVSNKASAYQGKSTVSSLVELAQYAMDAMGVAKGSRVTFSQIQNYKSQLESEFSAIIKKGLDGFGVAADASFTVSVDANGKILVNSSHADASKIQQYFDANPSLGKGIRSDLAKAGVDNAVPIVFNVGASGALSVVPQSQSVLQNYFDKNAAFGDDLKKGLADAGVDTTKSYTLTMDDKGQLSVSGEHPDKAKIQAYLDEHPEVADSLKDILKKQNLGEDTACTLTVNADGKVAAKVSAEEKQEALIRNYLQEKDYGGLFKKGLAATGVDKNVQFRLTLDDNGKVKVIGDHPDCAKVQKFFDDNPELAKKYAQIQALADIDSARKSLGISPKEMRRRIEVESMAAWWSNSGNAAASFGDFMGGGLSVLSRINARV